MSSGGVALAAPYSWSFTTTTAPVPTVMTTVPANGATGVNVANALTATFSVPMNSSTVTASTFTLTGPGNSAVAGLVTYNTGTSTATFTPNASLAYNTPYMATITTGAPELNNVALAANYVWTFTTGASPNQVTVDFGTTYQTIRGFGGSTAWLGQMPTAVATALFSPTNGLGLNILRVHIDPEGSPTGGGAMGIHMKPANGTMRLPTARKPSPPTQSHRLRLAVDATALGSSINTSTWPALLFRRHHAATERRLTAADTSIQQATATRDTPTTPTIWRILSAFSIPPTVSISTPSRCRTNRRRTSTYESCLWTPQQMDTWIAGSASTITSDPYSTKLIMPEADSFQPSQAATALNDPSAQGLISIIGGHLYRKSQPAPYSIPSGDSPKEIWMTEFGPLSNATLTWAQALTTYGESIHNSMVTGQYNAYVWWGLFGASTGSCATNAGTCGLVDNAGNVQPMGYVIGQYSKFIQPGYVRVSATATPVSGVYVSAYKNSSPIALRDCGDQLKYIVGEPVVRAGRERQPNLERDLVDALPVHFGCGVGAANRSACLGRAVQLLASAAEHRDFCAVGEERRSET